MAGSVTNIRIVDTTLREGEQFARAHFSLQDKLEIAQLLDAFGVDYLELTSPVASPQSAHDLRLISNLGLSARILTHTRCTPNDVRQAIDCGVHGVNLLFGTSSLLQQASHGRDMSTVLAQATEAIRMVQDAGLEVRFSCEDAFRTDPVDLLRMYTAVDALGVNRVGIADTVGIATPQDVERLVGLVRAAVRCDIEFHGHNDGGCAIANTHAASQAGATHLDTTILGIGERNGIASLSGLIARMYLSNPSLVSHYRLDLLHQLDSYVAQIVGIEIPFNSCITSETAFTHKAGLHTNAVLRNPHAYEAFDPTMFGRDRSVLIGHRLTGHNAIAHRARMLGIALDKQQCGQLTQEIKAHADIAPLTDEAVDRLITTFYGRLTAISVESTPSIAAAVGQ